jgi:hypothetical protein
MGAARLHWQVLKLLNCVKDEQTAVAVAGAATATTTTTTTKQDVYPLGGKKI